jgi:hypothetical protein
MQQPKSLNRVPSRRGIGVLLLFLATMSVLLAACDASGAPLSGVSASAGEIVPGSRGIGKPAGSVEVSYTLGRDSEVTVDLQGPVESTLFKSVQKAGPHLLLFNGVVDADESGDGYRVVRRAVPDGDYTIVVSANGESQSIPLKVRNSDRDVPALENVVVHPDTISPNSDAIDDVAEATFRTTQTSTISVDLFDPEGNRTPMLAPIRKGPGEQSAVIAWDVALQQTAPPDGVYTATIRSEDDAGNRVEASRPITIEGAGSPGIQILSMDITPKQVILGGEISVTVRVKNTGDVPLRTQGPDPGYTYTTNDSYSSIEGNSLTDKAGLWRVGVDWDGNSGGGGAYRYPFRWGFGKTLLPGEEAVTGGKIRILKQERTMWFFAGVLQEGVQIALDRLGRTPVHVDF